MSNKELAIQLYTAQMNLLSRIISAKISANDNTFRETSFSVPTNEQMIAQIKDLTKKLDGID